MRTIQIEAPRGTIIDRSGARPGAQHDRDEPRALARRPAEEPAGEAARGDGGRRGRRRAGGRDLRPDTTLRERPADPDRALAFAPFRPDRLRRGAPVRVSGRPARQHLPAQLPLRLTRRPAARLRRRRSRPPSSGGDARAATSPRTSMGQAGLEASYDRYLRGTNGSAEVTVDSLGRPTGPVEPTVLPQPGNTLRLTLDVGLQKAAEAALRNGINLAHTTVDGTYADGGAIVALDPNNGAVLALASNPTYAPSVYVNRRPQARAAREREGGGGEELPRHRPRDRRRLPARLGLQAGHGARGDGGAHALADPDDPLHADASPSTSRSSPTGIPTRTRRWTSPQALAQSCDTYFYRVGCDLLRAPLEPRADPPELGLALRVRSRPPGSTSAPSAPGSSRRPTGAAAPTAGRPARATSTASGSPATRCSSRSGRVTSR